MSLVALASVTSLNAKTEQKPNIIFILSDDHSYPYLGCYGSKDISTPNLDKLASEGMIFTKAYTTAPQSVPSRASLMTGRNVLDVEMSRFSAPLKREYITYPEILRKNGYYTGICGRSYHLDGSSKKAHETEETFTKYNLETFKDRVDYLRISSDSMSVVQFKKFLNEVPSKKPFFIQVGFSDPHRPYTAKEFEPNPSTITMPESMPDNAEFRAELAGHYGEISRMDMRVGLVLKELERRNIKNTIIIFMGDNGSALLRGKGTLYESGIHVPLIVKWQGVVKKGVVSNSLFSGEDLFPTILNAANIPIPDYCTGRSFVPTFSNANFAVRDTAFAIRVSHGSDLPRSSVELDLMRTVFTKDYKLIYNSLINQDYFPVDFSDMPSWNSFLEMHEKGTLDPKYNLLFRKPRPFFELYDLKNDPNEFNNLAGNQAYQTIEKSLKSKLQEWMIVYNDYIPLPIEPSEKINDN